MWLRVTCALPLLALFGPACRAQSPTPAAQATVEGSIRSSQNVALAAASVYLRTEDTAQAIVVRTDAKGGFRFSTLRQGTYTLGAALAGFKEAAYGPFVLAAQESKRVDLTLVPEQPAFFDEPHFVVAGVTDVRDRGGHGSDAVMRSTEAMAKATASLNTASAASVPLGSAAETERTLRDAIVRDPKDAELHHQLGGIEERLGKPLEAVHEYQLAAELAPTEPNLFEWGAELLAHRAAEPAIEVFTKGNRLFPRSVRMLLGLAAAWYAHGSYEVAASRLFEASDLDPADPMPYLFLGRVQSLDILQSDGFVDRMARFAKLKPENPLANYYYAASLLRRWKSEGDAETLVRARALLENAVRLDPNLAAAFVQLGILNVNQKDFQQAIVCYQRAIQLDPGLEEAHYRLGQAYARIGDKQRSQQEFEIHEQLAKKSAEELERERRDVLNFVFSMSGGPAEVRQ